MHQSKTNEGMEGKQENGQSNNKAILPLFHIIILAIMLVITVHHPYTQNNNNNC